MTKDEILTMEASDTSNTLIATEVLGYQVFEQYDCLYIATDETAFERGMKHGLGIWNITPSGPDEVRLCLRLPDYFGSIAAAWEVMEKMVENGYCPAILFDDNGHWALSLEGWQNVPDGDEPQEIVTTFLVEAAFWADTVPLAISRAALLAEVEDD